MDYGLLMSRFANQATGRKLTQQMLLYESLRHAILNGDIRRGSQLVPTRALAEQLGIARNSVLYAYERLAEEGFIAASRHGSVVSCIAQPAAHTDTPGVAPVSRLSRRVSHLPQDGVRTRAVPSPFQAGVPALDEFPVAQWRTSMERAWRAVDARDLGYGYYAGHPSLRRAVAEYVRVSRGVRCTTEQVFITSGTHTSLDLCARMLADPGDTAWLENPGYNGACIAFQSAGLNIVPIPVDGAGIAPTPAHWERTPPRLVYITPSHQYPLGSVLSLERRWSIIDKVVERGAWIIEDDYDSELRHSGPPLPSVQGLRPETPVVYLGTFSKTMFPALRIGFMIVPANLAPQIGNVIGEMSRQGRVADQIALADFIESGKYARHLRRMRRIYQQRREAMVSAIHTHMRDLVTVSSDGSGMHLTMRLDAPLQDRDVSTALRAQGISVSPLSAYCYQDENAAHYNGFMLGYAGVRPDKADTLIAGLAASIRALLAEQRAACVDNAACA